MSIVRNVAGAERADDPAMTSVTTWYCLLGSISVTRAALLAHNGSMDDASCSVTGTVGSGLVSLRSALVK